MASSLDENDILAELEGASTLLAVTHSSTYTVDIPEEDFEAVNREEKWDHITGVLFRRDCFNVDVFDGKITFSLLSADSGKVLEILETIQEELDEATGRKAEKAAGSGWGMF